MEYSARPTRGRQAAPTKPEIAAAWACIRAAAESGDIRACAALITISGEAGPVMHIESGILNLPGNSGWTGDSGDHKGAVMSGIRNADPKSKQLPENQ